MEFVAGLIGAVVGAVLGIVGALLTLRFNYCQLYAKIVSENRNLWRNELRGYIAEMVAAARPTEDNLKTEKYYIYRNQVLMRLSPEQPYHKIIEQLVYCFDKIRVGSDCGMNFFDLQDEIITISCRVMKLEWETVKKEAKGGK